MNQTGTRDLILDAAERLLGVLGYSKTTMDDVAKAAGVGKRTIYVYFPSKEEVTLCTIDRIVDRLVARLRTLAGEPRPAAGRLRDMIRRAGPVPVRQRPRLLPRAGRAVRVAAAGVPGPPAAVLRRRGRGVRRGDRGRAAAGEFDAPDPPAAAETVLLATNSLLPFALSARELGRRKDVEAKAVRVADLLLDGLCRTLTDSPHPHRRMP